MRRLLVLILLILLVSLKAQAAGRVVHVDAYRVSVKKGEPVVFVYPARVAAYRNVHIVARVSGTLIERYFTEGAAVKKGDPLFLIDPTIYRANVKLCQAELEKAKALLFKAKRDLKRYRALYKKAAVSRQKLDYAISAYRDALAGVKLARAQLNVARIKLGYTLVKATVDGITGERLRSVGDYVVEGTPLVDIKQVSPVYVNFSIPDSDMARMNRMVAAGYWVRKKHCTAYIKEAKKAVSGQVDYISPTIDPETSTISARAVFKNNLHRLVPGQFVKLYVSCAVARNVIFVPAEAVIQTKNGKIVFVIKEGRVVIRPIKAEVAKNGFIVLAGLKPGELVIVDNFFRIRPGAAVKVDKIINR